MKRLNYSPTFIELLVTLHKLKKQATVNPIYSNTFTDNSFERVNTNASSHRIAQPIVIADASLFSKCTPHEWYLVGIISNELKEYNCLWHCKPEIKKNNTYRVAIKGLVDKKIIIKTETTNIYVVNPLFIRRGDPFAVLATTCNMLEDVSRVSVEHITNKKPIKNYNIDLPQLGYGYTGN